jgi:hypothetical protein
MSNCFKKFRVPSFEFREKQAGHVPPLTPAFLAVAPENLKRLFRKVISWQGGTLCPPPFSGFTGEPQAQECCSGNFGDLAWLEEGPQAPIMAGKTGCKWRRKGLLFPTFPQPQGLTESGESVILKAVFKLGAVSSIGRASDS